MTDAPLTPERIAWMDDKLAAQDKLLAEAADYTSWVTARCNDAMGTGFHGWPNSAVAAVCDTVVIQRELIDHWRTALRQIANAESGTWGWIARQALEKEKP